MKRMDQEWFNGIRACHVFLTGGLCSGKRFSYHKIMVKKAISKPLKKSIKTILDDDNELPLFPLELVECLKEEGLLDQVVFDDHTPLTFACRYGLEGVAQSLLLAGADPNGLNRWGQYPLMWAAEEDERLPITMALMDAGANIEGENQINDRPLHSACFSGSMKTIEEFIKRGRILRLPGRMDGDRFM